MKHRVEINYSLSLTVLSTCDSPVMILLISSFMQFFIRTHYSFNTIFIVFVLYRSEGRLFLLPSTCRPPFCFENEGKTNWYCQNPVHTILVPEFKLFSGTRAKIPGSNCRSGTAKCSVHTGVYADLESVRDGRR